MVPKQIHNQTRVAYIVTAKYVHCIMCATLHKSVDHCKFVVEHGSAGAKKVLLLCLNTMLSHTKRRQCQVIRNHV